MRTNGQADAQKGEKRDERQGIDQAGGQQQKGIARLFYRRKVRGGH
jgi:hypothetical protein